jgi:ubiquinone/menaquinone biosynthesis C-methylase UbiE
MLADCNLTQNKTMKKDFIKDTWEKNADLFKTSHWASWGDIYAIQLEIDNNAQFIKDGDKVLDVGCANGYSAFEQHKKHAVSIHGIDFSEKMIEQAIAEKNANYPKADISFKVGDILKIDYPSDTFDVVYTTRVIINLSNWEEQIQAIEECIRVAKKGGTIVFSEAFWEPLVLLNALRSLKNLPSLIEHDFNRYIKKAKLEAYFHKTNRAFENLDFTSVYYLGSRFLRELVTQPELYPGYSNPINEIFYNIEKEFSGGGFGIQQAYVVKK